MMAWDCAYDTPKLVVFYTCLYTKFGFYTTFSSLGTCTNLSCVWVPSLSCLLSFLYHPHILSFNLLSSFFFFKEQVLGHLPSLGFTCIYTKHYTGCKMTDAQGWEPTEHPIIIVHLHKVLTPDVLRLSSGLQRTLSSF